MPTVMHATRGMPNAVNRKLLSLYRGVLSVVALIYIRNKGYTSKFVVT